MNGHLQIILHATKTALNTERGFVFPPVGDRIDFLEENEDEELISVGHFINDWTISFDKERGQYVVEIIATRKDDLPEEFGQHSYLAVGGIAFQVLELDRTQSHTDLQQPFVTTSLRPTIKIYCAITELIFTS
ncbi:MAG TPA: hypothetical protein VF648_00595 [Pyrinomonadaceae bacterium]|jgi:hypothetical protein